MNATLTIATRNPGKIREIRSLLTGLPFSVQGLEALPQLGEIPETGTTFQENALIKAKTVHKLVGGYVLADDSGIVCDDLRGEPGVYSARFAGPNATDEENNETLIKKLKEVHDPSRRARYVCCLALIAPDGSEHFFEATCEGMITFTPGGAGGFGYDPYFFLPDYKKTMAEISLEEKNKISHRGKAIRQVVAFLKSR